MIMTPPTEPNAERSGGLQSMLARLRGMVHSNKPPEPESSEDIVPTWDATDITVETPSEPPLAIPLSLSDQIAQDAPPESSAPLAEPVLPEAQPVVFSAPNLPLAANSEVLGGQQLEVAVPLAMPMESAAEVLCPACRSRGVFGQSYCGECGYFFPPETLLAPGSRHPVSDLPSAPRVQDRYELLEMISERCGTSRFRGVDYGANGDGEPRLVHIVRTAASADEPAPIEESPPQYEEDEEVLPTFDAPSPADTAPHELPGPGPWPSVSWERALVEAIHHPGLPAILDTFFADGYEYLVLEVPQGRSLWDAWDDPEIGAFERFDWLKQIADALHALHKVNVALEALRPDIVVVTPSSEARLTDLSDLLPMPPPDNPPLRGSLYTAPELLAGNAGVDARADLYSFGAMLYALHVGRELTEMDFERPGTPKPFIPCFPDIHPLFGRLVSKTFQRDPFLRFPTDEATKEDGTGFAELIRTLETCQRTFDNVRLEIAAWTTTGMVRTGNEDAYALLHTIESRQDDLEESALVLLADGMGGYEAGEIAAALTIQSLRGNLLQQAPFRALAGESPFPPDFSHSEESLPTPFDVEACKQTLKTALKEANKHVFAASRSGVGRRGMGCTAEAVYVNGQHVVVGHVGDSRTYHLHEGRLIQLTRDHTLVGRLVELGMLTPEEAETHPRRNELQQAIGGQPDVEPGIYHGRMKPGDWVVVCSDGLTNHVTNIDLKEMLQSEALSAEMAARRLINLVNIEGATDNATVVVIRAT
jgi:serine/threonine protein phosphatase PrpC